jgi:lariat debranching enzyme
VRAFVPFFSRKRAQTPFPGEAAARASITRELGWVLEHGLDQRIDVIQTFEMTVAGGADGPKQGHRMHLVATSYTSLTLSTAVFRSNPQTEAFCSMLQIENQIN